MCDGLPLPKKLLISGFFSDVWILIKAALRFKLGVLDWQCMPCHLAVLLHRGQPS